MITCWDGQKEQRYTDEESLERSIPGTVMKDRLSPMPVGPQMEKKDFQEWKIGWRSVVVPQSCF